MTEIPDINKKTDVSMVNRSSDSATEGKHRIPGEAEFWILILADLAVFTLIFSVYVFSRLNNLEQFQIDQGLLNRNIGLLNTLILLTSSLFVAIAVQRIRLARKNAPAFLVTGILFGASFVMIKVLEYREKLLSGIDLSGSYSFFKMYFAMTGLHLAHVLLGIIALLICWRLSRKRTAQNYFKFIECSALFWHMVDFLWIIIFALLYVIR